MVKASALFIVIVVALVIAILSSSLIMIAFHYRLNMQYLALMKRLELNVVSGVNYLLSEKERLPYEEVTLLDLYGEEIDSVALKKRNWGLFELGIVNAFSRKNERLKTFLYGYKAAETSQAAIYLADDGRPLSICGNTLIRGTCYLPRAGAVKVDIENQSFTGIRLVDGTIKQSSDSLPPLKKAILDNLTKLYRKELDSTLFTFEYDAEKDTFERSFLEKTLLIHQKGVLELTAKMYQGNVWIHSDTLITIDSSARLQDVLLFAPRILVRDGFQGSFQAFATDTLAVGENCFLQYPAALGLFKRGFSIDQPAITLGKNTRVQGIIFTSLEVRDIRQTLVRIEEDSQVEGQVYVDGYLELRGTVLGNVTCRHFALKTPSSAYENHLLNATVDNSRLSSHFVGSAIIPSKSDKRIIKWLE
jgi:hypothetical protein